MVSKINFKALSSKEKIDDNDVLALRRAMFGDDDRIDEGEAEILFLLNDRHDGTCNTWADFFIEAIVDFTVNQTHPHGYLSAGNADWLIEKISQSGVVKTETELELLLKLIDTAREIPEQLERFALEQVKHAVLAGEGPTRSGMRLEPGRIGRAEVELLRRVLYACSGADGVAISRAEAEVLFDINDAVSEVAADENWSDLFVKAVANYVMAVRGYQAPNRAEAVRREAWLNDTSSGAGGFFGKMVSGGLSGMRASFEEKDTFETEQKAADIAKSEVVTENEVEWLSQRIGHDGHFSKSEMALLAFIKAESSDVHPSLEPLLAKVA